MLDFLFCETSNYSWFLALGSWFLATGDATLWVHGIRMDTNYECMMDEWAGEWENGIGIGNTGGWWKSATCISVEFFFPAHNALSCR
jgi:hypothetical protein